MLPKRSDRQNRAISDVDRAQWLRLAQGWPSWLTKRSLTAQERFDHEVVDKGFGQDEPKCSN
jgi:hypothetical protein